MLESLSGKDVKVLQELKETVVRKSGLFRQMTIREFQDSVTQGIINDESGIAQLIIKDEIRPEYFISIDRKVILKTGQIVSFWGLLKMYSEEEIAINYIPRSLNF